MATKQPSKKSKKSATKKSAKKTINKVGTTTALTPGACMDRCFDRFKRCVGGNPRKVGPCLQALNICLRKCVPVKKQ